MFETNLVCFVSCQDQSGKSTNLTASAYVQLLPSIGLTFIWRRDCRVRNTYECLLYVYKADVENIASYEGNITAGD